LRDKILAGEREVLVKIVPTVSGGNVVEAPSSRD
jgi:hypothetical protein